jgi:Lar family restriction alleviation protein
LNARSTRDVELAAQVAVRSRAPRHNNNEAMKLKEDDIGACPFCASTMISVVRVENEGLVGLLAVECNKCRARGPIVDATRADHALQRWNVRTGRPHN